ncbi:hypothetical protein, partial [Mesorhizobium sp.]|uniref:hypothetical protein n=1 Tax=Mesorhizobium sp. TaxID=1871066 RepID=UPI0025EF159E
TAARPADGFALKFVDVEKFTLRRSADDCPREIVDVAAFFAARFQLLIVGEVADANVSLPAFHQKSSAEGMRV